MKKKKKTLLSTKRFSRVVNPLVVIVAVGIVGTAALAITHAASSPDTSVVSNGAASSGALCDNYGGGDCLQPSGSNIVLRSFNNKTNQHLTFFLSNMRCNGGDTVTSTCPFTDHSLDTNYHGDAFGVLQYNQYTYACIGASHIGSEVNADTATCNKAGAGTIWVEARGAYLANVAMSDSFRSPMDLFDSNGNAELGSPGTSGSWRFDFLSKK